MGILDNFFNKDNNDSKIKELEKIITDKDKEIKQLKEEIKNLKDTCMSVKQVAVFEKNLKATRELNVKLKNENESLSKKVQQGSFALDDFIYKLPIIDFFTGAKFKEIREILEGFNIEFIQEFEIVKEDPKLKETKHYKDAIEKYKDFKDRNEVVFENRVTLCKGEKTSKVFKKSRKFLNYLTEKNIEFMDDLKDFDFESLPVKGGFSELMAKELKNIADEYFKNYRIK